MKQQSIFKYIIDPGQVDFQKNLSPIVLTQMIVDAAGKDADNHGFGLMDLHAKNCSWVLSRITIEMNDIPTVGESLSIETWVKDVGKVFTTRNFELTNGDGKVMGYAALSWAILDLSTRQSISLTSFPKLSSFINDKDIPIVAGRVPDIEGEVANGFEVKYSDLDLNVHTNVLKYLQCVCDVLSLDFYAKRTLKRIEINFLRELNYADKGSVYYEEVAENDFIFKLKTTEGITVSRSRLEFEYKK